MSLMLIPRLYLRKKIRHDRSETEREIVHSAQGQVETRKNIPQWDSVDLLI